MENLISTIRTFNRFYVRSLGLLKKQMLDVPYSLSECRIIFEVGMNEQTTASDLKTLLSLDEGYVSRIVSKLVADKVIAKEQSTEDKRLYFLTLTAYGLEIFDSINTQSNQQVEHLLEHLSSKNKVKVATMLQDIQHLLDKK